MKILKEVMLDDKQYLFRGESNNSFQSNYSKKFKTNLKSRYYAWEPFDGIYTFGDVVIYELLDDSNLFDYDDSVEQFIEDNNLEDFDSVWLYKIYGVNNLSDPKVEDFDYHDLYHARQLVATDYLENNSTYDGIIWYEWGDTPESQVQIWNNKILRKLKYKEAKEVNDKLYDINSEVYSKSDAGFWDKKYTIHK